MEYYYYIWFCLGWKLQLDKNRYFLGINPADCATLPEEAPTYMHAYYYYGITMAKLWAKLGTHAQLGIRFLGHLSSFLGQFSRIVSLEHRILLYIDLLNEKSEIQSCLFYRFWIFEGKFMQNLVHSLNQFDQVLSRIRFFKIFKPEPPTPPPRPHGPWYYHNITMVFCGDPLTKGAPWISKLCQPPLQHYYSALPFILEKVNR